MEVQASPMDDDDDEEVDDDDDSKADSGGMADRRLDRRENENIRRKSIADKDTNRNQENNEERDSKERKGQQKVMINFNTIKLLW